MKTVLRCEIPCKDRAVRGALCLPQAGCPAVLFCHGFGGSVSYRVGIAHHETVECISGIEHIDGI